MDQNLKLTEGYRAWSAFVNEFRDIQSALLESKDAEGRLIRRCDRLKSELVSSGNKLQLAIKVRAEDERTMVLLRKECDKALKMSIVAKRKEHDAQALVKSLKVEVDRLKSQVGVLQTALWLELERAALTGDQSGPRWPIGMTPPSGTATPSADAAASTGRPSTCPADLSYGSAELLFPPGIASRDATEDGESKQGRGKGKPGERGGRGGRGEASPGHQGHRKGGVWKEGKKWAKGRQAEGRGGPRPRGVLAVSPPGGQNEEGQAWRRGDTGFSGRGGDCRCIPSTDPRDNALLCKSSNRVFPGPLMGQGSSSRDTAVARGGAGAGAGAGAGVMKTPFQAWKESRNIWSPGVPGLVTLSEEGSGEWQGTQSR